MKQSHAARLRLDYVLINEPLRRRGAVSSIVHDDAMEQLSDHYPVRCGWSE
ncbi:hypothetical protein ACFFNY_30080 [Paenibacillus hodogayensis]|uniref:Endonuclease/exonuclease/phosphatase domain-containing protein n=1 Tax=Paenibacillus hodogayensis TaxID=279208 RepID=A0ABV5W5M2_9BACL